MMRKAIGTTLIIASIALGAVLLSNGRFIFPHVLGPGSLAVIGVILLAVKARANKSIE